MGMVLITKLVAQVLSFPAQHRTAGIDQAQDSCG
jgi:hypothetical protein